MDRKSTALPAVTALPYTGWTATAVLIAIPVHAAETANAIGTENDWLTLGGLLVLATVFLAYRLQIRLVKKKTVELRRELFERQVAEKELLSSQQKLRRSLAEKESLLKEIHHRVKNNLQVVSSLLYLQEEVLTDPKGIDILRESQNRIKSMALIHEQLYSTDDFARIDFGRYVHELASNLTDAYGIDPAHIQLNIRADDVSLGVDMAVPCGLIINELVSNAFKHAFSPDTKGIINIVIRNLDSGRMTIEVADNGIGIADKPAGTDSKSLGLRLADTMTTQLGGRLEVATDNGTRFSTVLNVSERLEKES